MPNISEFWRHIDSLRHAALSGDTETAEQILHILRASDQINAPALATTTHVQLLERLARLIPGTEAAPPLQHPEPRQDIDLQALDLWPRRLQIRDIRIDRNATVSIQEDMSTNAPILIVDHPALADLLDTAFSQTGSADFYAAIRHARQMVLQTRSTGALIAYERYLDLIVDFPPEQTSSRIALRQIHTMLGPRMMPAAFRQDPSDPFNLLGMALACLRTADRPRGFALLRRLASSGYPARRDAQRLLTYYVEKISEP